LAAARSILLEAAAKAVDTVFSSFDFSEFFVAFIAVLIAELALELRLRRTSDCLAPLRAEAVFAI